MDKILQLIRLKTQGFCCAQIVMKLALDAQGKDNTDLVRSVGGLCFGINWSGEACGALLGGACLISLYAGKGSEAEEPDDNYVKMMGKFVDWFNGEAGTYYGGNTCNAILDKFPDRSMCGKIVVDTYDKCLEILAGHGCNPACGKNG